MNFQQFIEKYQGGGVDWDGFPPDNPYQCVDLYRQYCHEVVEAQQSPPVVGAYQIWDTYLKDKFERFTNYPSSVPKEGDVMIWGKSSYRPYGHVSIFIDGNVNTFASFDQNSPIGSLCHRQGHTYSGVLGWLRPKGNIMNDECTKQLTECKIEVDSKNDQIGSYAKQVDGLLKDLSDVKIELGEEQDARKGDLQKIATKLACSDDLVEILKEIEKLIVAEEGLVACLDDKRECGENYAEKSLELSKVYENIKLLSGYSIKTPEGVKRSLEAYTAMHSKQAPSEIIDYAFLVRLFGYTIFTKKEE